MGKGSTAIQSDIERQRGALSARINRLEQRVRDDVDTVKSEASSRATEAKDQAFGTMRSTGERASGLKERLEETKAGLAASKVSEAADNHPGRAVAAALGAGVALGLATGGGGRDGDRPSSVPHQHHGPQDVQRPSEPGMVRQLAGKGFSSATDNGMSKLKEVLKFELGALARDFLDGAFGKQSGKDSEPEAPAPLQSARGRVPRIVDRDLPPRTNGQPASAEELPPVL